MGIFNQVNAQIKDAMRERNKIRVTALRNIKNLFLNEAKKRNSTALDDDTCIQLLRRIAKRHNETINDAKSGKRDDIIEAEKKELAIVMEFLPKLADEDTTRKWVKAAIEEVGATEPKDIGKVMGAIMKSHRREVDGSLANKIAREVLT